MDGHAHAEWDLSSSVSRLFTRLRQDAPAYDWDETTAPFHSSYDNWHVFGNSRISDAPRARRKSSKSEVEEAEDLGRDGSRVADISREERGGTRIVARISRHLLRLEREYRLAQRLYAESAPAHKHFVRPLDFVRMGSRQPSDISLVASIFQAPGPNHLRDVIELGPNVYTGLTPNAPTSPRVGRQRAYVDGSYVDGVLGEGSQRVLLPTFFDFAIGATECCEILHHGNELVHGELRADAFHFDRDRAEVRLVNFGSGARSFENGLTSAGWSTLTSQVGVENRLQFIAPEQTGRMPAEPDSRTDIYSLGVLFWIMLAAEPAFTGASPLDVMQNVLSRKMPPIDSKRSDVPHVVSRIIQKMTQKNMDERYQSSAGLKFDLTECKRILGEGDVAAVESFQLGTKDVSCFFNLPKSQIGRQKQLKAVVDVIEKAASRAAHGSRVSKKGLYALGSSSTTPSFERLDSGALEDMMSDSTSSGDRDREPSVAETLPHNALVRSHEWISQESVIPIADGASLEHKKSFCGSSFDTNSRTNSRTHSSMHNSINGSLLRSAQRLRRAGRCEVISLSGTAGLGKSSLLANVQVTARNLGYYASSKFDQVQQAPFEPLLKLMSSLFRQIFSESDVSTEFHNNIRTLVRPVWPIMHSSLELPPWLLSQNIHQEGPLQSHTNEAAKCGEKGNTTTDWLQGGGTSRDRRFVSTFLDTLRLLALQKFLCLCIDDLQFADDESLELIYSIVSTGIPIVLILTLRSEDALPIKMRALLDSATKVELTPFTEQETSEYVTTTLRRTPEYVLPLVAVVQEKTGGNPFFIREMLDSCYRRGYIFYSWRTSQWEFDLDQVFNEYSSPDANRFSSNDSIVRRLGELQPDAQALLCWASLIGNTFSFTTAKHVMCCECAQASPAEFLPPFGNDPIAGLQAAISAYTIMATDDEDRFRFAHDRYLQAADLLCESFSKDEMHYVISVAMMKHDPYDGSEKSTKLLFEQSRHVCSALEVIKKRATLRRPFRELLYQAAEVAREQGARSVSLYFLQHSLELLAEDPWETNAPNDDIDYQETLTLMTQTAASYWFLGYFDETATLLGEVFQHAREPADRSAAFIIQARMHAQQGDANGAFQSMKRALADLGIEIPETTMEECDADFEKLLPLLKTTDPNKPVSSSAIADRNLLTIGAVLVELNSAAFWSDTLLFYQMSMKTVSLSLERGLFPQVAIGYVHLSSIAIGRFKDLKTGIELGDIAKRMFDRHDSEAYTNGRGLTLHAVYVGHLQTGPKEQLVVLERALEASVAAGDKILHLQNVGITAAFRVWCCEDLQDIEAYIDEQHETFPNWPLDLRGGVFLTSVRQYIRALQGKTLYKSAATVMEDEDHKSEAYKTYIQTQASAPVRPLTIYDSYRFVALFRFGFHREALDLGESLESSLYSLLSMKYGYYNVFYLALCLLERIREEPESPKRERWLFRVREHYQTLKTISQVNPMNFASWLHLLDAELAEIHGNIDVATAAYEAAIDHSEVHSAALDEGLGYELFAEYLIRRGATRPARTIIASAIAVYHRIHATGKAQQIAEKHAFLLHGARSLISVDAGTQTAETHTGNTPYKLSQNEQDMTMESSADRTQAWVAPGAQPSQLAREPNGTIQGGFSAIGLDMIDLASILESSQLLSSELNVDKLLAKLTEIILESTGAELCSLVTNDDEHGWSVMAVGGPDGIMPEHTGTPVGRLSNPVARQIATYVLRFRERVFLQNVLDDERFATVTPAWRTQYPDGRAFIALPILHGDGILLGSILIEGPPRSFTERNTTVLRLLVNQISISIANATLFKKVEQVSASNAAMLEMQKQALAQAREAERRAKMAEAKAMEMVRLTEEAAKAKSMFLANVSHELRTPLNGVIGLSELLKGTTLNSEQEGFADSIRICADTLLSVINDILDFSKLEAGKMQMFNVQLSLTETISEVVRALSYTNLERGLKTVEQLELDRNLLVMGDPVRLHQILMNLLSNAYKFTAKGTVTVKAVVNDEDQDSILVTCSVTDTGIGVSEEQRKKLFLPFSQADSSTARSYGGTGLGLSICKAIIENVMNGKIWLQSTVGVGTTVAFSLRFQKVKAGGPLPVKGGRDADPMALFSPIENENEQSRRTFPALAIVPRDQLKICIAEDNPINQKIAISFVQKLGFKCEAFGDGQQAVDALGRASADGKPFHLVLMDVQMPVLDGYNATREIRKHADVTVRDVLVIAMTASAIRGDREKCLEAGMNNYLAKPVRAHVLKQMLESYLNQAPKPIANLQQKANELAKDVIQKATTPTAERMDPFSTEQSLPLR